ncbi:MAG: inositol monophosphatase [Verrucomicrobia bacterium]|nr:MAG: inositol monophosphatase [Verrucomicrobiota bacterium]
MTASLPDEVVLRDFLDCACSAVRAAGRHAQSQAHRRDEILEEHAHDVKLVLDRESQLQAERIIRSRFPDHFILGEETLQQAPHSGDRPTWIIDPIDGTLNFLHGLPLWCSSVAVAVGETVVAGAVYVPPLEELYAAHIHGPATLNGSPIHPSTTDSLNRALALTGLSKHVNRNDDRPFTLLKALALNTRKVRIMGAAALDICHVACGRADAYVESSIYLWDVAAAGLIARRAGAKTTTVHQYDRLRCFYICANSHIHDELLSLIRPYVEFT